MAAGPVLLPEADAIAPAIAASPAAAAPVVQVHVDDAEAQARRMEARVRQLEAQLDKSASLGDTIASAMAFAATVSTEAAINAAIEATDNDAEQRQRAADNEQRRHARKVRGALAVPYFSFAQGLRRNSRS